MRQSTTLSDFRIFVWKASSKKIDNFINNVLFVHLDGHNDACFRDYIRENGIGTKASSTYV